ncbi:MAG: ABC transporter ATP-binding protein [Phycisphaeraceae bacterium]|nr:ABC transporter ATP-binding protein [Phycisphaeraceae bacterium]
MLRLDGVSKTYGSTRAVDRLELEVRPGEVLGLLGPNGAGKTTTIRMAVGLLRPDEGRVTVRTRAGDASSPDAHQARRALGVAPQALALYEELTARENLRLFGALYGVAARQLAGRIDELLEHVGLADRASARVSTFSGGMKRRLNLAAAIVHDPEIVLLDEPTAGVDPQSRHSLLEMVAQLRAKGCAVIYTTHYMEEAQKVCDRVAIMDHGRLLALDTVDALIESHGGESIVVAGTADGEERLSTDQPLRQIEALLSKGDLRSLRIDRPDLETVFLNLTGRRLRD